MKSLYFLTIMLMTCGSFAYDNTAPSADGSGSARAGASRLRQPKMYPFTPQYLEALRPTEAMEKALRKALPDFRPWSLADYPQSRLKYYPYSAKTLPYVVKGDFNGDGVEDMVLYGHDDNAANIVALMSGGTDYYAISLNGNDLRGAGLYKTMKAQGKKLPYTPTVILNVVPKGAKLYRRDSISGTLKIKTDGVNVKEITRLVQDTSTFMEINPGQPSSYVWSADSAKFMEFEPLCPELSDPDACF